jgi:hypothetical protein
MRVKCFCRSVWRFQADGSRGVGAARGMLAGAVVLAACSYLITGSAAASPQVVSPSFTTLTAAFVPNKLDAPSTMELGFQLHRPAGDTPPPLIGMEFDLPAGVSLTTSELGQETCEPATLASTGPKSCKPDTVMGYGNALIVAPDVAEALLEPIGLTVFQAPAVNRHTTLLFYGNGSTPAIAQELFSGQMLEASGSFGADLDTTLPLLPGLPGEPDTTVMRMYAGIGPKGVTYYKNVHGVRVAYKPQGLTVPSRCPAGGFPFGVRLRFADGSTESASTTTPCPSSGDHARREGRHSQ